jgi:hypothetical protein
MLLVYLREKVLLHPSSGPFRKLSLLPEIHREYKPDYNKDQGGASRRLRASGIGLQEKKIGGMPRLSFPSQSIGSSFFSLNPESCILNPESFFQAVPTIL